MWKPIAFLVSTVVIAYISRASLRDPSSHGFTRFFAWEAILGLVFLNIDDWFANPWRWYQLISWVLLFISLYPVIEGLRLLRQSGKADQDRQGESLLEWERTTQLVTNGLYKYIRHPLYSSLLFLAWGTFFKLPSWFGAGLACTATLFLILTAKTEEKENIAYFGPAYEEYMEQSKMFVPFIF